MKLQPCVVNRTSVCTVVVGRHQRVSPKYSHHIANKIKENIPMQIKMTMTILITLLLALTACTSNHSLETISEGQTPIMALQSTTSSSPNQLSIEVGQPLGDNSAGIVIVAAPNEEDVQHNTASTADIDEEPDSDDEQAEDMTFEDYGVNPFVDTTQDNLSTFAMDVDTGSYTLARSYLTDYSEMPPPSAIRSEEFINYFPPAYNAPTDGNAFAIHVDAAPSPFSLDNQVLMRVGIQGRIVSPEERDPALLIFVIDVSGSMDQSNRLELAKEALTILVGELREDDRVGIVIYADQTRVILEPTPASEQETIINTITLLRTEGSTYAEAGLALGYEMALAHMRDDQTTRVILVSDGVANVGATGPDAILETISQGVESGITLSTVGVGMGNYNDVLLEQLANDGNGNYHYVDNIREARRIFVNNLTSTLQVIGYDARIQVEFNPDVVARYRLIGYENRDIADELFRDDTVDAGEVGAGHTITALYEVELIENSQANTIATVYLRYEDAETDEIVEINRSFVRASILQSFDDAPVDLRIIAAVAEFSEMLRGSEFADSSYSDLLSILEPLAPNYPAAVEITNMINAAIQLN